MIQLVPGQHIHLIGIGGFGLSAIARVLLQQGYYVSGSDRTHNALTQALARDGAMIFEGHDASQVEGAELVIVSSAIPEDHVEVQAAVAQGIPVYKRADVIATIMSGQNGIAIAGTHGKTTTTAMLTHILIETDQRPSYIIGGVLRTTGKNADVGTGKMFVIEADEYDNMFHGLRPLVEVVTNVEFDHPDFFDTPSDLARSFSHFIGLLPPDGLLIACADDPISVIFAQNRLVVGLPVASYGIDNRQAIWRAVNLHVDQSRYTAFDVSYEGNMLGAVQLMLPGRHNVLNTLAAIIAADSQGVPFGDAARALKTFQGVGRRFELRGEVAGVAVIDDYAHHPTAIRATLDAARQRYPGRTLWAVWQPHTYSRTQALMGDYLLAFDAADHVLVTDIYAAREAPVPDVTSAGVVEAMRHGDARHVAALDAVVDVLEAEVREPAAIIIMSAGDAPVIGVEYLKRRRKKFSAMREL